MCQNYVYLLFTLLLGHDSICQCHYFFVALQTCWQFHLYYVRDIKTLVTLLQIPENSYFKMSLLDTHPSLAPFLMPLRILYCKATKMCTKKGQSCFHTFTFCHKNALQEC